MNTDQRLDRLERLLTDAERLTVDAVRDRNPRVARTTLKLLARLAARLDAIVRGTP